MKILLLEMHLSTGGAPQFALKRAEVLKKHTEHEVYVVEYQCYSMDFVVQRDAMKSLLIENFFSLGPNKMELMEIIDKINPDIVHIDEMSERLDREMVKALYSNKRNYRIVETCHDVSFNPKDKIFKPDLYLFCTPYHVDTFGVTNYNVITYPIVKKFPFDKQSAREKLGFADGIHVINVGLWTPGKNQGEGIEMARKYPEMTFHFIGNQAGNFQEYWQPLIKNLPSNVKVWGERADVETFMQAADIFLFNSTWECNPLVLREAISHGLPIVARNLPQYKDMFKSYLYDIDTDLRSIKSRNYVLDSYRAEETFANLHHYEYVKVKSYPIVQQEVSITQYFVVNPYLEINCPVDEEFLVQFFDNYGLYYENTIKSNTWVKLNRQWFTKWRTKITAMGTVIYDSVLNYEGKRVAIVIDSDSLGDNIAWIPYCLEFQKKHKCQVVVVTNRCNLFKDAYPELEFLNRGEEINNIHGQYMVGWYYDADREPELCNTIPLQKTATNILGLEYREIRPRIGIVPNEFENKNTYITIATNSTAACKFWTREAWQELINHFVSKGYKVINVSRERNQFHNCVQIADTTMEHTIDVIYNSKFFVGLSSGLSWLAWALNKKVVMIANFTQDGHEFSDNTIRITNKSVCHGCWNNKNFRFDKGDYEWCPILKGYPNQFECQTSITPQMVLEQMKPYLIL